MSSVPEFFERFPITAASNAGLSATLEEAGGAAVTVLFLWGYQCPNCDVAKRAMLLHQDRLLWPAVRWLHCNVYDDAEMATRFSLHGVPVFMEFRGTKSMGRITGWPGIDRFTAAIEKQLAP
jgi:hypothetical protein